MSHGDWSLEGLPPTQNFLGLPAEHSDPARAGVIVQQVPFEATSTFGVGSSVGPAAILDASREVELFDAELGCEPWQAARGIATLAPLPVVDLTGAAVAQLLAERTAALLDRGKFVVTIGGEHTSIVGAAWAHADRFPNLTVVQFDAHSDLRPEYHGTAWNHACAIARIRERSPRVVAVGIRSQEREERRLCDHDAQLTTVYAHEVHAESPEAWLDRVIDACGPEVYVTFDFDALDPALMPATGTPEPGGLTWQQATRALRRLCRERRVVGVDFNELAPIGGLHHPQFVAAKLIYRFLGYRFRTAGS
ncbi:MAG: agmatinase [Planctomycetota bacterium]